MSGHVILSVCLSVSLSFCLFLSLPLSLSPPLPLFKELTSRLQVHEKDSQNEGCQTSF